MTSRYSQTYETLRERPMISLITHTCIKHKIKGKGNPNHIGALMNKVVLTDIVNDSL
jgi:hypothetical protein